MTGHRRGRSARAGSRSRPSASAPGPPAAAAGRSAGGRRTTRPRSPRSARGRRAASTGSTPPPSTVSAIRRKWWARVCATLPAAERPLVFTKCGLHLGREADRMVQSRRVLRPESIRAGMRGLAAAAGRGAHRPLPVPLARRDGHAGRGLVGGDGAARGARARCARPASRTSAWRCSSAARRCGHVDSLQPPFSLVRREVARPRSRGAPRTAPASSSTARCSRGS